jgi:hypothetical protein
MEPLVCRDVAEPSIEPSPSIQTPWNAPATMEFPNALFLLDATAQLMAKYP